MVLWWRLLSERHRAAQGWQDARNIDVWLDLEARPKRRSCPKVKFETSSITQSCWTRLSQKEVPHSKLRAPAEVSERLDWWLHGQDSAKWLQSMSADDVGQKRQWWRCPNCWGGCTHRFNELYFWKNKTKLN